MPKRAQPFAIALETGSKRIFASALDWPGWCRSGKDEATAIQALFDYGPRYQRTISAAKLGFATPKQADALDVVERLPGNATTDFGAPGIAPTADAAPVDAEALHKLQAISGAAWGALKTAYTSAQDVRLSVGPRGGGRDLDKIIAHVVESNYSYLRSVGWAGKPADSHKIPLMLDTINAATADAIANAANGTLPAHGPRGGIRWSPRYLVRRVVWHILDHVWEIEDRAMNHTRQNS